MITSAEFKKHISKTFGEEMRKLGFKGSGFSFSLNSSDYFFAVGIQASQYGNQCCAEFGFQPKSVDTNGFENLDFKKLKYYDCEFRTRITPNSESDKWWKYSLQEKENEKIAYEIIEIIKQKYIPIIQTLTENPDYLEIINLEDLENVYLKVKPKLFGMDLTTTDVKLAWTLMMAFEKKDLRKAKEFAKFGLSKLEVDNKFFGRNDFERVVNSA
jgi:hypothetical protein